MEILLGNTGGNPYLLYKNMLYAGKEIRVNESKKIAALGISLMMTMSLGGDVLAADIPVQEEAAVVSVEDIAGETEDEEITITASATKAYAKTSKVVTLTVKKVAKNGKVTIRKRTPKRKYKITVTAAGKGIYGKKLKVITITIK